MKFLALEKDCPYNGGDSDDRNVYEEEAMQVYRHYRSGKLREIYFNEQHNAVLMLECDSETEAWELIDSLPLVRKGLIRFELMQLNPYTGLERLFLTPPYH